MSGWYRSPSGVLTHADGPSQVLAYTDRGYTPVDDAAAQRLIGDGVELTVDRGGDTAGTFDAEAVAQAVAEEGSQAAARSAAARKGAETKRQKKAEAAGPASGAAEVEVTHQDGSTETVTGTLPVAAIRPDEGTA